MSTATATWMGQTLAGRYEVTSKLGEGGMGFVYRARDRHLQCDVVIKVPRPHLMADPDFATRFAREIRALVQLTHPHIVKIQDVGQQDALPFAVMQYLPGGSLEQRRRLGPDGKPQPGDPRDLAGWLESVAAAIDFIHTQGFIHRDIKPANILFDAHGNAYVSDFGVAKALARDTEKRTAALTGTGMVLGTPDYMAPELVMGEGVDGRIDQYALAVTVFEMLAGRTLFTAPTPAALLFKHATDKAPLLHEVIAHLPPELSSVLDKALAKKPGERYANCAAFARAMLGEVAKLPPAPPTTEMHAPPGKVQAACPACQRLFNAPSEYQGKKVRCPVCKANFVLPIVTTRGGTTLTAGVGATMPIQAGGRASRRNKIIAACACGAAAVLVAGFGIWWFGLRAGSANTSAIVDTKPHAPPPSTLAKRPAETRPAPFVPPASTKSASADLVVSAIDDVTVKAGDSQRVQVAIERRGYRGTIRLSIPDCPKDVRMRPDTSSSLSLMLDKSSSTLVLTADREARDFDGRVQIVAKPTDGPEVTTGFRLTVRRVTSLAFAAVLPELTLVAGQSKKLPVRLTCSGHEGSIQVQLSDASKRISAPDVSVIASASVSADLELSVPESAADGIVSARVVARAGEVTAERDLKITVIQPFLLRIDGQSEATMAGFSAGAGDRVLVGYRNGTLRMFDTSGKQLGSFEGGHTGAVRCAELSADGQRLASGGDDRAVCIWNAKTGLKMQTFTGHRGPVYGVYFAPTGRNIQTYSEDGTHREWSPITGSESKSEKVAPVVLANRIVTFTKDQRYGLSWTDSTIQLWLLSATNATRALRFEGHTGPVRFATFSPDGRLVISAGDDKQVRIWDRNSGKELFRLSGHTAPVLSVDVCPDGSKLVSASADKSVRVWKMPAVPGPR